MISIRSLLCFWAAALVLACLLQGPVRDGHAQEPADGAAQDKAMEACYRGSAAQQHGQHQLAISYYNECVAWSELPDETLASVLANRAASRLQVADLSGALRDYGAAIDADPTRAESYNGRCWTYALLRRTQEALADCEESLRLAPDEPDTLDSRALVFWLSSRDDLARADLERARTLDASFPTWQARFKEFDKLAFGVDP